MYGRLFLASLAALVWGAIAFAGIIINAGSFERVEIGRLAYYVGLPLLVTAAMVALVANAWRVSDAFTYAVLGVSLLLLLALIFFGFGGV